MVRFLMIGAVCAAALLSAGPLWAQQGEPLQKSDIVRLLTGTTYTKAEVAGIVRQSCLSFAPTARDRADFRALGADDAVMSAIEACADQPGAAAAAVQLSMNRRIFNATAGDTVRIPAEVTRAGAPVAGIRLRLEGSSAIPGGTGSDATAVTDSRGRAVFVLPVGTAAGYVHMSVVAPDRLEGATAVTVGVRPDSPTQAVAFPDPVQLATGGEPVSLRVQVQDRYGNPVDGVPVAVRLGTRTGAVLFSGTTSLDGDLDGSVTASQLGGENRLAIVSGSTLLGYAGTASPEPPVASLTAASGAGQSGDAGRPLLEPLVVVATRSSGAPAANVEIQFSAVNGMVNPAVARTDGAGQVPVAVTMGSAGTETTVTATAGEVTESFTFAITVGGMTAAEVTATLAEAAALMDAGDYGGARDLYARVSDADPSNYGAAVGVAESYTREGRYEEAIARYRALLRNYPASREARVGIARANLGAGETLDAARWFELALSQDRNDVESLVGLGDARRRLGDRDAARAAYQEALFLSPGYPPALAGLDRIGGAPSLFEGDLWGGYTGDNGRDPGLRWGEVRVYPSGGFELYGGYDDALNFRHPYLVRGRDDIRTIYGGLGYSYGTGRAYRTSFEFGRREEPVNNTIQTTYTLDQTIGFGSDSWFKVGGWLGHWFDRDDWVVFARAGFPTGSVIIEPALSYGDYFGSGLTEIPEGVPGRAPAKEVRIGLSARYDPNLGFGVEPGVAYGNVDSEASEELSGALWDATLRAWYKFSHTIALDGFFQYQAPPGLPSFWRVGLGLRFGIPRSN